MALLPFVLLRRGHIPYLLFLVGLTATAYIAIDVIENFIQSYAVLIEARYGASRDGAVKLYAIVKIFCWIFFVPFLITATALPVRILWVTGRTAASALFELTLPSLQRATVTLYLIVRKSTIAFIAAAALYLFKNAAAAKLDTPQGRQLLLTITIILGVIVIIGAVRFSLAAIAAVCGQLSAFDALGVSAVVFRGKLLRSITMCVAATALLAGVHLLVHGMVWTSRINLLDVASAIFVVWYVLTLLAIQVMSALAEFYANQAPPGAPR